MEDYYKQFSFFNGVDTSLLCGMVRNYEAGSVLYYEGDSISLHFLVSGSCKAYKMKNNDEVILYRLSADSLISDVSTIASNTVGFLSDSIVLSVSFDKVQHLKDSLLHEALKRNQLLNSCIDINLTFEAIEKVCYLLSSDLIFFNSQKRSDIANFLNIKSETLSRVLKKLQVTGVISIQDRFISIEDKQELEAIFS